jgi:cysteine desulfuration protein SufE
MEHKSCLRKQAHLIRVFAPFRTPEAIYEKIIELGCSLTPLSKEYRTPNNLVNGCQSNLYLRSFYTNKTMRFQAYSDALISSGLAALFLAVYDDEKPETILKCPPDFIKKIGISSSLSPSRANGVSSFFLKMQQEAIKILTSKGKESD